MDNVMVAIRSTRTKRACALLLLIGSFEQARPSYDEVGHYRRCGGAWTPLWCSYPGAEAAVLAIHGWGRYVVIADLYLVVKYTKVPGIARNAGDEIPIWTRVIGWRYKKRLSTVSELSSQCRGSGRCGLGKYVCSNEDGNIDLTRCEQDGQTLLNKRDSQENCGRFQPFMQNLMLRHLVCISKPALQLPWRYQSETFWTVHIDLALDLGLHIRKCLGYIIQPRPPNLKFYLHRGAYILAKRPWW